MVARNDEPHLAIPQDGGDDDSQHHRLDKRQNLRRLWSLFWLLAKPFFFFAPGAKLNFFWVIFLILLRSAFVVVFSFLSRDFWTALQHKDVASFWRLIRLFTIVLICALPTLVWSDYAQMRLALRWRKWFTEKVISDYFSHRNYYQIDQQQSDADYAIDNPDQRIAQDVDSFTFTSLSFFFKVTRTLIDLFNFSVILFSIYPSLFLILLVYSAFGTTVAILLGRKLINLNFRQLKLEADFRYALIRVRENAESIAFYHGEQREKAETNRRFDAAYLNRIDLLIWTRNLSFFTESYTYLVEILPLALIAPLYFEGNIEMGVVSQASQAFRHILSDLSIIVDEFDRLSAFSAGVDRLGELEQFMYDRFAYHEDKALRSRSGGGSGRRDDDDGNDDDDNGAGGQRPAGATGADFVEAEQLHKSTSVAKKGTLTKTSSSDGDENVSDRIAATLFGRDYTLAKFRSLHRRGILSHTRSSLAAQSMRQSQLGSTGGQHTGDVTHGADDLFKIIEEDDTDSGDSGDGRHGLVSRGGMGSDGDSGDNGNATSEIETIILPSLLTPRSSFDMPHRRHHRLHHRHDQPLDSAPSGDDIDNDSAKERSNKNRAYSHDFDDEADNNGLRVADAVVKDEENTKCVDVRSLTVATPDSRRRVLFEGVSFSLRGASGVLIAGPSGTGKSSLLRAIAGLWTCGSGEIHRPALSDILFLPQKPYCTLGTLRQQLVYPRTLSQTVHVSDAELLDALGQVNLADLPSRMGGLDTAYDWTNVLSLGEQQRLAFARLLVGQPKLAILDECSSALDVATEERLYNHLRRMRIAFISVGHRPSLLKYHDYILRLGGRFGRSSVFQRIDDPATQEM